ncbi:GspH/FimT family pseudopilin [Marinibactrum halimedae]|uniref:Type II secretion system protein H n=1 Tax=Marinibactrum halimedae TaxID=1444977 RepID=A0AA37T9F7_9GAMM|nr:GspH/FimT family pseudopilin [Marinibactrum halimedae]MCD9460242.1 GspH/FimT family pseudopilin [Marinibactrum halimedae]GLS27924.1 hypothetical protein GCM10007877_36430 [Marinibactrum halimedae]
MKHQQGYTFIEIFFTLCIATILVSMALPSWSAFQDRNTQSISYNALLSAVNFARMQAISQGEHTTLCPKQTPNTCGTDWTNGILVFTDKNRNGSIDNAETPLREFTLSSKEHSLIWSSFQRKTYLTFTREGVTANQNGTFVYCPANKTPDLGWAMIINKAGRVYRGVDSNNNGIEERSNGKDIQCS